MNRISENVDPAETEKFDQLASHWWDPDGECKALHDINGPRVQFMAERVALNEARLLDIGCGGGLLTEACARRGADVVGIDLAKRALSVARMHAEAGGLNIDYRHCSAEGLAEEEASAFDVVCCMELLEHVPTPSAVVEAAAQLTKPGGTLFFSTIHRNPMSWASAIIGAEYLLGLLPKGTHRYERFIKPSELASMCRDQGLHVVEITGLAYNPWSRTVTVGTPPWVNYFVHAQRPR